MNFYRKNCPNSPNFFFQTFLSGVLTQSVPDETGIFNLLMFYQMLNKRSKQHSLLHFLTGKLNQTGFPILRQFDSLDMLCGKAREEKQPAVLKV